MDLHIKEGVTHSLHRGDTIVVTLAGPVSTQGKLLMQRQLYALFPAQKVVVLDYGMTFQVYGALQSGAEVQPPPAAHGGAAESTQDAAEEDQKIPARRKT